MRTLRYGRIGYVNVAPVETAFDSGAVTREVEIVTGVPTQLNAALLAGELDVAAVSAAHYLAHRDSLELVGDLCIAADGPVRSVLLVSPVPPALLDGRSIAVTAQSASARALLAILLRDVHGVAPAYEVVNDALAAARDGRPALVIGDDALAARKVCRPACTYDLGEGWRAWTGLPFVFAVWAVRREVHAARPADVAALAAALATARTWGEAHRSAVIDAALAKTPYHRGLYEDYFKRLSYVLDDRAARGLARFAALLPSSPQGQGDTTVPEASRVAR